MTDSFASRSRLVRRAVPIAAAAVAVGAVLAQASSSYAIPTPATGSGVKVPTGFSAHLVASAPAGTSGPDDIAKVGDHLFVAYQNGVGAKGEPAPGGNTKSTVVEYTQKGQKLGSWNLTGKVDGLGADPAHGRVIATVNEDGNSSLYTIKPGRRGDARVTHFAYGPKPLPHGGGTDSVVAQGGTLYISASAPAANADGKTYSKPALFSVKLSGHTAKWTTVFSDNAKAKDAVTGKATTLNLSDPDSSENVPSSVQRFGGDVLLDSQGDKQLVFLRSLGEREGKVQATVLNVTTQVDDTAFAPKAHSTLYVIDSGSSRIFAITGPFKAGEALVSVPKDSDTLVHTLGLLNLKTGAISTFGTGIANPKGLLFVS